MFNVIERRGLAIGRAIAGWILSIFGYVPNVPQTPESLHGIMLIASIFSMIVFLAGVGMLFVYQIDAKTNLQMTTELAARRKKYAQ